MNQLIIYLPLTMTLKMLLFDNDSNDNNVCLFTSLLNHFCLIHFFIYTISTICRPLSHYMSCIQLHQRQPKSAAANTYILIPILILILIMLILTILILILIIIMIMIIMITMTTTVTITIIIIMIIIDYDNDDNDNDHNTFSSKCCCLLVKLPNKSLFQATQKKLLRRKGNMLIDKKSCSKNISQLHKNVAYHKKSKRKTWMSKRW